MNHTLDLWENLGNLQHFEHFDFRLVALKILELNWTIPSTGSGCHRRCNNFQRCALSWCHLQKSVCFLDPWGMNPSREWDVGYRLIEMFTNSSRTDWLASFDHPEAGSLPPWNFIHTVGPLGPSFSVLGFICRANPWAVGACQGLLSCRMMHGSF